MEPVVRRAGSDDAAAIAAVHVRSWQAAYRHIFGAALDELTLDARERMWREWFAADRIVVLVGEVGGTITGFASAWVARDDPGLGELLSLYLLPETWGSGLAEPLAAAALAGLAEQGCGEAILWVLEDNPRARRFYERTGWRADGARRTGVHLGVETPEVRYRRDL